MSYTQDTLILIPAVSASTNLTSAFAGLPPATLQTFLSNAQTALAALLTGGQPVTVSYGEGSGQKSVTYAKANEVGLRRHISELQILLGNRPRRGAIPIMF